MKLLLFVLVIGGIVYFFFSSGYLRGLIGNSQSCRYEIIDEYCYQGGYTEAKFVRYPDCVSNTTTKYCSDYGVGYGCNKDIGKCARIIGSVPVPLPPALPQKSCIKKVVAEYCQDGKKETLCAIIEGTDCIWRTECKRCSDINPNFVCGVGTDEDVSLAGECHEEMDIIVKPSVIYPTTEETLINLGNDIKCPATLTSKWKSSEGYTVLKVNVPDFSIVGCIYSGWTSYSTSSNIMVITSQTRNFFVTYEHEKCHLVNKHLPTSNPFEKASQEKICIDYGKRAESFFYSPPKFEEIK